jgi:hypothetical protein
VHRVLLAALLLSTVVFAAKKKDDLTQTLALPPESPAVAVGETQRLVFQVSPLSAKGLLSQQTRDALKAILKFNGGARIVHIRAFVAGSADPRRVPQLVSEVLAEKKDPLPSVSVVQIGELPLEGAQVQLEAVSEGKKEINPDGLAFLPLGARIEGGVAVAVTCYASGDLAKVNAGMTARYPSAAVTVLQPQRASPPGGEPVCEAVMRGGPVKGGQIAFTGTRVGFNAAAVERLKRDLTEARANPEALIASHVYTLDAASEVNLQALSRIPVDGVASIDATFALDAVAAVTK